jgi:hypothetical protein
MKILDRLKAIGLDLSRLREINLLKLSVTIDRSVRVDKTAGTVTVNPAKLNGKRRRALKKIIRESPEEIGAILDETALPRVEEARAALPLIETTLESFASLIPREDAPMLRACLYLRARFLQGECVESLKAQIVRVYGVRGRNAANLCSAGYLEEWFNPLYKQLQEENPNEPEVVRAKFQSVYNAILTELPWTMFVCSRIGKEEVTEQIVQKMQRNAENGIRFFNVHGLGKHNAQTIHGALPDIKKRVGAVPVRMDQDQTLSRIFVRLEMPPPAQ